MSYLARSIKQNDYSLLNKINQIQAPKHNLVFIRMIGQDKTIQPRPEAEESKWGHNIVLKALEKFCTPQQMDKIVNGYRRSDGSDLAAEINFLNTDEPKFNLVKDEHYLRALKVTKKLFQPSKVLKPVSFPDLRYYPWTLSTSAEAPYTMKEKWRKHVNEKHSQEIIDDSRLNFHNLYDEIFQRNRTNIHKIKSRDPRFFSKETNKPQPYYWHSLHTRAHLVQADEEDKNRAVFGTPKLLLMAENMFIWPLQKEYLNRNVDSPLLWGYETFKAGWQKIWNKVYTSTRPSSFLGIDWKGFDRKALHEVIDDVHSIWKSYFDFKDGYEPTNQYQTHRYPELVEQKIENLWEWMTHCIKQTPILAPSGRLYRWKWNGIASGFQQTQLLDSFVNTIMVLTCLSALGINIESPDFIILVQGDDSLVTMPERIYEQYGKSFLSKLAQEALLRFNATLSEEKSTFSNSLNDIEVLGYSNRYGIAYRNEEYLLAQLLYPERPNRKLGALASAAVGISMASMGQSKLVYQVCYDVWNYIVNELKYEPKHINLSKWMGETLSLHIYGKTFPSMLELKDQQQLFNKTRRNYEKQKLWPTDPSKGFYFLRE